MCLKPILVDNPNFGHPLADTDYGLLHDCTSQKLEVPCGHCEVCICLRQAYLVQRMQMESIDNLLYFGMVSYNPQSLPYLYTNDFKIRYAYGHDMSNMMRHVRLSGLLPPFRYFAVSEFGGNTHRPHWHFIVSLPKSYIADQFGRVHLSDALDLEHKLWHIFLKYWRRNYGGRRYPEWRPLLTYKRVGNKRNYDLTFIDTLSGSVDDAAFYATKYATKYDEYTDRLKSALFFNLPSDEFSRIWKIVRPRTLWSKGFGDPFNSEVASHIIDGINRSLTAGQILPCFFNPNSGQSFPLSPYYQKKFLWTEAALEFKRRQRNSEKRLPDIYETQLSDLMLKRKQSLIYHRNEDPYIFLDDGDYDPLFNKLNLSDYGNFQTDFELADFSWDEW